MDKTMYEDAKKHAFERWLRRIDAWLERHSLPAAADFPDWPYRDAFEEGLRPAQAASEMLAENGYDAEEEE